MLNSTVGLSIFALGVVLLIFGLSGGETLARGLQGLLNILGGNRNVWMIVLGVISVAAGLMLAYRGVPKR